jgi:hypothetical protein
MELYDRLANTAIRLLEKYGQTVVLRSILSDGYDTTTGKQSLVTIDTNRKGLVVDAPANRVGVQYGQNLQPNTLVQSDNKWMYLDPKGTVPKLNDRITIGGKDFVVINVQAYNPAGTVLLYLLVLKT